MKAEDVRAGSLKKDELVDWVAEQAAAHVWAPPSLSWVRAVAEDGSVEPADDETGDPQDGDDGPVAAPKASSEEHPGDGSGAFVITAAGEALLETTAA